MNDYLHLCLNADKNGLKILHFFYTFSFKWVPIFRFSVLRCSFVQQHNILRKGNNEFLK